MRAAPLVVTLAAAVVAAGAGGAAVARAEPAPPASRWVGAPRLPAGRGEALAVHELRLSTYFYLPGEVGDPWATGVDVAHGVDARLTIGLGHSSRGRGTVDHGGGWCHDGPGRRCSRAYAGALVDARLRVHDGERLVATALVRAGAIGLGPLRAVVRLGGSVRTARGRWWLVAEPEVQVALGRRAYGNRDTLIAPLWLGVGRRRAAAWLLTGARGQLVGFGEKVEIPVVLGAGVGLGRVRAGIEAGWPKLLGPQNTANVRQGTVWLGASF